MAKPMKTLELHYPMIQFLITTITYSSYVLHYEFEKGCKSAYLKKIVSINVSSPKQEQQIESKKTAYRYNNSYVSSFCKASQLNKYLIKIYGIRRYKQLTSKRTQMITIAVSGFLGCCVSYLEVNNPLKVSAYVGLCV